MATGRGFPQLLHRRRRVAQEAPGNGGHRRKMEHSDNAVVDHSAISIMMKGLESVKDPKYVERTFALLDRARIDVFSDEILLNALLETCVRHREYKRLSEVMDAFSRAKRQPELHTYGSLIKANSSLNKLDVCWVLWREMTVERAMQPNHVGLGCMLDALGCKGRVEDAVVLLEE